MLPNRLVGALTTEQRVGLIIRIELQESIGDSLDFATGFGKCVVEGVIILVLVLDHVGVLDVVIVKLDAVAVCLSLVLVL